MELIQRWRWSGRPLPWKSPPAEDSEETTVPVDEALEPRSESPAIRRWRASGRPLPWKTGAPQGREEITEGRESPPRPPLMDQPNEPRAEMVGHVSAGRGWLKNGNVPGDLSAAPRCGARTRNGKPCRAPAIRGRSRCRLHGGCSTGPRTPDGLARSRRARWIHGRYSQEAKETRAEAAGRRRNATRL